MATTPKKSAGTRTRRAGTAKATVTLDDLVAMLGIVQRELALIAAGMTQLIREGGTVKAGLTIKVPTLLVGPYCHPKVDELLLPGEPVDALDRKLDFDQPFDVVR